MKLILAVGLGLLLMIPLIFIVLLTGQSLAPISAAAANPGTSATIGLGAIGILFLGIVVIIAIVVSKARG